MTLAVCIMLLVACVIVSKKVFAKVKLQEEPLIGLSSTFKTEKDENMKTRSGMERKRSCGRRGPDGLPGKEDCFDWENKMMYCSTILMTTKGLRICAMEFCLAEGR